MIPIESIATTFAAVCSALGDLVPFLDWAKAFFKNPKVSQV
jgi:hypothetical protein